MGIKQKVKSLTARNNQLADTFYQLEVISNKKIDEIDIPDFSDRIKQAGYQHGIKPAGMDILQINIGKLCNQACAHCHVDAGPDKKEENMNRETLERCLEILKNNSFKTVDITGGAPELNPNFRWFVEECRMIDIEIIVRCNLTIILANKRFLDLPDFYARNHVHIVSSLPYFTKRRTDSQRGDGVFEDSILALQKLNAVGYGKANTGLVLDLVYNPSGAFLPGSQCELEEQFKQQLDKRYGIEFNNLYAITNLPISRFLDYLIETGNYADYMTELSNVFNPATLKGLMCRNTISVSWDGYLYDCDFNQMLDLKSDIESAHIGNFDPQDIMKRKIVLNQHCYGCTAGAGSSCGGEIA
ncbi:MAG: radical SAM/Cys-rich domain protein [Saprospiraceae bacterium]|nr:arsenosugar biosynthesis radical SAM protein ArsS [Bacteroidia bacterium]NNK90563.1 radical SAM/Cys-rich domain protein [Saprospiraceae bacterium]